MSIDLAVWLLEQIAEDERLASAVHKDERKWRYGEFSESVTLENGPGYVACGPWDCDVDADYARHMVNFDPARVLAECDAKRRMLELHQQRDDGRGCYDCDTIDEPCGVHVLLALPYVRPGYREEWRP